MSKVDDLCAIIGPFGLKWKHWLVNHMMIPAKSLLSKFKCINSSFIESFYIFDIRRHLYQFNQNRVEFLVVYYSKKRCQTARLDADFCGNKFTNFYVFSLTQTAICPTQDQTALTIKQIKPGKKTSCAITLSRYLS